MLYNYLKKNIYISGEKYSVVLIQEKEKVCLKVKLILNNYSKIKLIPKKVIPKLYSQNKEICNGTYRFLEQTQDKKKFTIDKQSELCLSFKITYKELEEINKVGGFIMFQKLFKIISFKKNIEYVLDPPIDTTKTELVKNIKIDYEKEKTAFHYPVGMRTLNFKMKIENYNDVNLTIKKIIGKFYFSNGTPPYYKDIKVTNVIDKGISAKNNRKLTLEFELDDKDKYVKTQHIEKLIITFDSKYGEIELEEISIPIKTNGVQINELNKLKRKKNDT